MKGKFNWAWGGMMIIGVILVIPVLATFGLIGGSKGRTISASATSPDIRWRALLVEFDDGRLDRNFEVYLETVSTKELRLVFSSPDEGRPIGTERFIWSKDGRFLLLVGRQFGIMDSGDRLSTGEYLYLLCDLHTGVIRCNARQQNKLAPFLKSDVRQIEWVEPLKTHGSN
jgi:hypothetical protein